MSDESIVRQITDTRVLAALTHPLRRRIMDVLLLDGPATASMIATATDQAVGNISHHLKVLAQSELVAEAPELARDRRERWWRLVARTIRWSSSDFADDPSSEALELAAMSVNTERQTGYVRQWMGAESDDRQWWGEGPFSTNSWLRLTPEELVEYGAELIELMKRWRTREVPEDGQERRTVFTFAHGVPAKP